MIPLAAQTFSKCYTQFSAGAVPLFLEKGKGAYVWDVDRNKLLDYQMALAPVILGYGYPEVNRAAQKQMEKAVSLSLPAPLEVELAEKICSIIPSAQMVRFGKNGSDATSGAVRAARAHTGRDIIACCGYHGWQDWYVATTARDQGVPESTKKLTKTFKYNDIKSLEKIFKENKGKVAAVIMEPMGVVWPKDGFLQKVKKLARKNGALLIFDEIVTGFRLSLGGGQEYFGVRPDLSCFGKSVANGFPISFVCGKKEIMKKFEDVFFSFTFGGELVSMAAALATIEVLEKKKVPEYITKIGYLLQEGYNGTAEELRLSQYTKAEGYGARFVISFKDKKGKEDLTMKTVFQQELARRGILFGGSNNVSLSHTRKDAERTLKAYREALQVIKKGLEKGNLEKLIEGRKLESVFRKA